jgi:PAS domain S-box-containing protein
VAPDLIITDVLMPEMNGYELMRQLQLDPSTSQIPVLFYTAPYGEREARARALATGIAHVLTKPADPERVLRIVASVLAKEAVTRGDDIAPPRWRHQLRLSSDEASGVLTDLRIANAQLRAVINITLQLSAEHGADALLLNMCAAARDLFGATYGTVGIVHRTEGTAQQVLRCGEGSEGTRPAGWLAPGDAVPGILGSVVASGRAMRGDNPGGDPAELGLPASHPRIEAYLVAPLASDGHVYGWICLAGNEGRSFTDHDEQLLLALAVQVGHMYELEYEITERRAAEASLRLERDRAQRYLDSAQVILLALDTEGRVTLANRYACSTLECPPDEVLGRDWIETFVPERVRPELRAVRTDLLGGGLSEYVNPVVTASGAERLIEWRNTPIRGRSGDVVGIFSSGTDVTDRNRALEAKSVADEREVLAMQYADVGIWDWDMASGVLQWSPILERHHGLAAGTFGGTFADSVAAVHPDDREALQIVIDAANRSGRDFTLEYRVLLADGAVRWVAGAGRIAHDESGRPVRGIGITLDVTARHELEAQYQQAQKMEAVGRLAGGVAHDFNNLLTAILGYCELVLDALPAADPLRADVAEIQSAGNSAAALTRQLLAFSRKQVVEQTVFDLNVVVSDMRPMLARLISDDIAVRVTRSEAPAVLRADLGQVQQVVMNLAVNARDAMPAGGTLSIAVARRGAGTVTLTVADTGTGMPPEVRAHLFEPFFTTKGPGRGTGLGLATVQGIVTQCGGRIEVTTEVGRGTTFEIVFPSVGAEEMRAPAPAAAGPLPSGTQTILVVEDADGLRELTRRLLARQGYTVLVAADAVEALALVERHASIDVMLTDVVMPGTSGPALSKQILALRPALKVIYMSGYPEGTIAEHGVLAPGIDFLHKPFNAATLGQKVKDVIARVPAS